MIIDAHNHADWFGYGPDEIVADMNKYQIEKTWLVTWEAPEDEVNKEMYVKIFKPGQLGMPFTAVLEAIAAYPERFVAGYCPDPRRPEALEELEAAVECYGVKLCGELKLRMMYDNVDAIRLYRLCARYKLPVTVHLDYPIPLGRGTYPRPDYWYGGGIETFERAMQVCPETIFIAHAPGFWSHISQDEKYLESYYPEGPIVPGGAAVRMLRQYPNLYADLSANSARNALTRDREFGKEFLLEFQDRLLFGRDEFTDALQRVLEDFALPPEVLEKIYRTNALKLIPVS
ncbi:amidohydrolase family protein [candidate division KSB3 bacterium]|uniref:Amidohydrolase family protein n=1 Tax=candidate division KSB3 bacterium TaxID=2044937 RepID=A0A9D5JTD8_9BACT|nr:amidohydrolase family protein [candidate division KSB3 bacterium]MBD3323749.1 amidohydrolase family protein [candidate division KSB3 bacterium]